VKPFVDPEVGCDEWDHGIHTGLEETRVSTGVQVHKKDPHEAWYAKSLDLCKCAVTAQLCDYQQLDGVRPKGNAKEINQLLENESNKRQHKASIVSRQADSHLVGGSIPVSKPPCNIILGRKINATEALPLRRTERNSHLGVDP
jgi:hypothetical protein